MPLDNTIDEPSFKKNVLFKNNAYQINNENDIEFFLSQHNILKSYYYNQVSFQIKVVNSEYSKEYGNKDFVNYYETFRIKSLNINGFVTKRHTGTVYSSKLREFIISISGINDSGESIFINFSENQIKP